MSTPIVLPWVRVIDWIPDYRVIRDGPYLKYDAPLVLVYIAGMLRFEDRFVVGRFLGDRYNYDRPIPEGEPYKPTYFQPASGGGDTIGFDGITHWMPLTAALGLASPIPFVQPDNGKLIVQKEPT